MEPAADGTLALPNIACTKSNGSCKVTLACVSRIPANGNGTAASFIGACASLGVPASPRPNCHAVLVLSGTTSSVPNCDCLACQTTLCRRPSSTPHSDAARALSLGSSGKPYGDGFGALKFHPRLGSDVNGRAANPPHPEITGNGWRYAVGQRN